MFEEKQIFCKDCNQELKEKDKLCFNCGSKYKRIILQLHDKLRIVEQLNMRVKDFNTKKTVIKSVVGDDFSVGKNKYVHKERVINKRDDKYFETVKDKETGEIIHNCDEKLSEHKGHGSAKFKKKK